MLPHGETEGAARRRRLRRAASSRLGAPTRCADVVVGAGFAVDELVDDDGDEWIDVLGHAAPARCPTPSAPGMRLLVCGLNPSVYSADAGIGFARPGQPLLARGARGRHRDPRPRPAARARVHTASA